ncbi:hypothetical protein SAMN03159341_105128 [Paenibacillus sp. 1_12]|uniref:hypothetical protein n=1 Tax=Paenibacillus sp. 1_12 TaxID=1566278 RepID=UPI0008E1F654|nr:hypothetical protein [Paenibacillus sp. 1_12]SFL33310.1 hypothetical protein SAMN03159341_105128 [Paenibacillus sp. 1_12]
MAEKSMQAYFHSPAEAQSIISKLNALRVRDMQIKQLGSNLVSNEAMEWSTSAEHNADTEMVNTASFERESTISNGDGRLDTLLTVLIDEMSYEQALRVIRSGGGVV